MGDEPTSKQNAQAKPSWRQVLKETNEEGAQVILDARSEDTPRAQFLDALLFGVSVVSLLALLSVPHLDAALQFAVHAFAVAGALLPIGITFASTKFNSRGLKGREIRINALRFGAWVVGDGLGSFAVLFGVAAVVWHLSEDAFWLGVKALVGGFGLTIVVALVYASIVAWQEYNKYQASQATSATEPHNTSSLDAEGQTSPVTS